ncbi:hypothetical protein SESBI_22874 [Sesbania bispinosa]|nr:hypothetical protein SESBI_22874 [Sesbania bispinosa]
MGCTKSGRDRKSRGSFVKSGRKRLGEKSAKSTNLASMLKNPLLLNKNDCMTIISEPINANKVSDGTGDKEEMVGVIECDKKRRRNDCMMIDGAPQSIEGVHQVTRLRNAIACKSDHSPIILCLSHHNNKHFLGNFKFENAWLHEPDLADIVQAGWNKEDQVDVMKRIASCTEDMNLWGRKLRSKYRVAISDCKQRMEELRGCHDTDSIQRYNMLHDKMNCLIMQEEAFWKQRAKVFWLREGNGNTRFFHAMANARKKRNVITALTDEDDRNSRAPGWRIKAFKDPWLKSIMQSHVSSTCPRGGEELTVADFIDASRGHWKVDMIRSFFSAADVNRILSIHLSRLDREDSLIWKLSKDGSAQLCQIVPVEAAAGLLANENESAAQRSVVPSHFIACWQKAGMWQLLEQPVSVSEGFQETAFFLLSSLQYNMKHKFAMVLWSLWKQRNKKVWEGVQRATSEVVTRAQEAFTDWNCVKSCGEVGITSVVTSHNFCWFPPQAGRVKCNVDAALFADQNGFGVGLCLRDDKGQYIKSKVLYHHGSPHLGKQRYLVCLMLFPGLVSLGC